MKDEDKNMENASDTKKKINTVKEYVPDIVGLAAGCVTETAVIKVIESTIGPAPKNLLKKTVYLVGSAAIADLAGSYAMKGTSIIALDVLDNIHYIQNSWKKNAEKTTT